MPLNFPAPKTRPACAHSEGVVDGHRVYNEGDEEDSPYLDHSPLSIEHPRCCYPHQRHAVDPKRLLSTTEPVVSGQDISTCSTIAVGGRVLGFAHTEREREEREWVEPTCPWPFVLDCDHLEDFYRGDGNPKTLIPVGESRLIRWCYRYWPGDGWESEPDFECWWDFAAAGEVVADATRPASALDSTETS